MLSVLPGAFAGSVVQDVNLGLAASDKGGAYREPWMETIVTDQVVVTPDGSYILHTPPGLYDRGGKLWGDVTELQNPVFQGAVGAMNRWGSVATEAGLWLTPTPGLGLLGKGLGRLGARISGAVKLSNNVGYTIGAARKGFSKTINFGKIKVPAETFHRQIKPNILSNAGSFSKVVGRNPDIKIVGGKIRLTGTGPFKGKSFNTNLDALDFFGGF